MSRQSYNDGLVEQDFQSPGGGNELPTYDDLAEQQGPNSRFGRWRGWIEKRAAERYVDITPEVRRQRRQRGWGNEDPNLNVQVQVPTGTPEIINSPPTPRDMTSLQIQTQNLTMNDQFMNIPAPEPTPRPLPFRSQKLRPTRLKMNHFGSRFLPHATTPIRCLLPLLGDRLLLIGHEEGLSVLDMYPQEWTSGGNVSAKNPDEAMARVIWTGESVYQMSLLEVENETDGAPAGVVLALVGPESSSPANNNKEVDAHRTLRMYNLASLTSLAKWAVASKGAKPLDLSRPSNWNVQQTTPSKRHRAQGSFARGLRSLIENPSQPEPTSQQSSSYQRLLSPTSSVAERSQSPHKNGGRGVSPKRHDPKRQDSSDSWDMVDDLPLRWATDFVPLATANSRLNHASVITYALWAEEHRKGRGGQMLAVATKNNILLYETPRGERAFRFVKEFYTPLQPRSISFFQQSVPNSVQGATELHPGKTHHRKRSSSGTTGPPHSPVDHSRSASASTMSSAGGYSPQLGIFVCFDKKAGWIRLADSAVGEIDLFDDDAASTHRRESSISSVAGGSIRRTHRLSMDNPIGIQQNVSKWAPPAKCDLPVPLPPGSSPASPATLRRVYFLTRESQTHIVPAPLPMNSNLYPPLRIVNWRAPPTHVTARVIDPSEFEDSPPFLQLVSLSDMGVEVQEISLSFLAKPLPLLPRDAKGKGKASLGSSVEGSVTAIEDLGGTVGFLCPGGHWDNPGLSLQMGALSRNFSTSSGMSGASMYADSFDSDDLLTRMKKEEGMYGWVRKGAEDYRVFWIGGSIAEEDYEEDDIDDGLSEL